MGRMRIVHVVTRSHRRGAEIVALELAEELDRLGHHDEVHAIAFSFDAGSTPGLPALVETSRLGARAFVLGTWRLRRLLSRAPADVVLAHGGWAAIVVAFAVPSSAAVRVWQRILGLPVAQWGALKRRFWRAVGSRFEAVVALTGELEAETRELGFTGPVWIIPNARNPDRFAGVDRAAASAAMREQLSLAPEVPLLGFVGHLVDQKQPELAVDVVAAVRSARQPAHLVIAGDGPRRPAVEQRAADRGARDAVTLLGHRDDTEAVYGAVDLVLLTSRAEGIPGVAIEAAMSGCPIVSFPVGSVAEVVDDGVTGIVLPQPDVALMSDAVVRLLRDPVLRASMGTAAAARSSRFSTAETAAAYAARFAELVPARH
jgi:glycosyltransferase involved in cell wall biosynthesis